MILLGQTFIRQISTTAILFFALHISHSYGQASCANIDFEMGNLSNWVGNTGSCCPITTPGNGIVAGRHTIMSGPGTDPNTCGNVPFVYPGGGNYSARLGNASAGSQSERLTYTFLVSPNSTLFIYRYAVVLEDPSHSAADQPRFEIKVLNSLGTIIDPVCGFYSVVASSSIPGFQSCGTVRYKNWTTVGIDLSAFLGQNISIQFSTGDCALGAHFGYAYIEAFCSPLQITGSFCSNSTTPAVLTAPEGFTYQWSTGETTQDIIVTNPVPGSVYSVIIRSVTGCTATLSTQLLATVVNAGFNVTSFCQKNVTFADASSYINEPIINWRWDFGDGTSGTDQHPVHAYANAGPYQVTLITSTISGCKDTTSQIIDVVENPVAQFTSIGECTGTPLQLTNSSSINTSVINTYVWNDGNGNTYGLPVPTIVYGIPGIYPLSLLVTAANGCTDSISTTNIIHGVDAVFSHQDNCLGIPTNFIDSSTAFGDVITNWTWNLGDGSVSSIPNPEITYNTSGQYFVSLEVNSNIGCNDKMVRQVNIFPVPSAQYSFGNDTNFCGGDPIFFLDQTFINSGFIATHEWDFGDGSPISGVTNPYHSYPDSGVYNVSLITTSDHNCIDSTDKTVNILNYPTARFSADSLLGCQPLATNFTDSSSSLSASGATWLWDFGDGNISTEQNPLHVYEYPGVYNVELSVSNYNVCYGDKSIKDMITVLAKPESDFIFSPNETSILDPEVSFYEKSQGATSWFWDFGDNRFSEGQVAVHKYYEAGNYKVMLISENDLGCVDTVAKPLRIRPEFSIFAPTAFSPNGDGINDFFDVAGIGIDEFNLVILNRWGEEIFVSNHINVKWNGGFKNNSTPSQNDVYVWKVKVKDALGDHHNLMGRVTLIK